MPGIRGPVLCGHDEVLETVLDLAAVVGRVRGMLFEPDATLAGHGVPAPGWRLVVREHALPVLAGTSAGAFVLAALLGPATGPSVAFLALFMASRVIINLAGIFLMASVVRFYAGLFGSTAGFDAAFVLVALAMTPVYVAEMLAPVVQAALSPAATMLLVLLAFGYSFAILYRGTGLVLGLPPEHRGAHFGLTLVTLVVLAMLAGLLLGPFLLPV